MRGGATRLSTIHDVTDSEEASALTEQPQQHAEDDPQWFDSQQQRAESDWGFLRLVEENRKQRQKGSKDGTFIPPPRSSIAGDDPWDDLPSSIQSAGPPHQFPPAANIIPTPASIAQSKQLPAIPPPSNGGDQWWDDQEQFDDEDDADTIPINPNYDPRIDHIRRPRTQSSVSGAGGRKKSSDDSVVTAIHYTQLKAP